MLNPTPEGRIITSVGHKISTCTPEQIGSHIIQAAKPHLS